MKLFNAFLATALLVTGFEMATYAPQAHATYTPKIKNIRIRQTTDSTVGSYRLEVVSQDSVTSIVDEKGVVDPYDIQVTVDKNRVLTLEASPLNRRLVAPLMLSSSHSVEVTLLLEDAHGLELFKGIGRGGAGQSARFESVVYNEVAGFTVNGFSIAQYAGRNNVGFSVDMNGDGSVAVAQARIITTQYTGSKIPVVKEVLVKNDRISSERIYSTDVKFTADPVGAVYELDVVLTGESDKEKFSTDIQMIRLPGSEVAPGPILGVTSNGKGTRNSASNSQQTQQAELL